MNPKTRELASYIGHNYDLKAEPIAFETADMYIKAACDIYNYQRSFPEMVHEPHPRTPGITTLMEGYKRRLGLTEMVLKLKTFCLDQGEELHNMKAVMKQGWRHNYSILRGQRNHKIVGLQDRAIASWRYIEYHRGVPEGFRSVNNAHQRLDGNLTNEINRAADTLSVNIVEDLNRVSGSLINLMEDLAYQMHRFLMNKPLDQEPLGQKLVEQLGQQSPPPPTKEQQLLDIEEALAAPKHGVAMDEIYDMIPQKETSDNIGRNGFTASKFSHRYGD
ncbi:hypothetical protein EDD11_010511 [Mortierella claussenii]|nr:hypothetical protein EDD11_010511 [Mortierella claussenii]